MNTAKMSFRVIGTAAGVGAAAAVLLLCACRPASQVDCWDGLAIGQEIRLTLIAPYTRDAPFEWIERPASSAPSCGATVDSLDVGEFRFRISSRTGAGNFVCGEYGAMPLDDIGVSLDEATARIFAQQNVFSNFTPIPTPEAPCRGAWDLQVRRSSALDRNPFDELAVEGEIPPVFVQRGVTTTCTTDPGCFDEWVAEVALVE